jgi:hypothetical protein
MCQSQPKSAPSPPKNGQNNLARIAYNTYGGDGQAYGTGSSRSCFIRTMEAENILGAFGGSEVRSKRLKK